MKDLFLSLIFLILTFPAIAQETVESLVRVGVRQHDAGAYDAAIATYLQALDIDSNDPLANYELAHTYFTAGRNEEAVDHAQRALRAGGAYELPATIVLGSALDNQGKTKKAIKLFERAIKKLPTDHLLHYNLALAYIKERELAAAENELLRALAVEPGHASSHLALAEVNQAQGDPVEAVLAAHYFLLLEPRSARSAGAYRLLLDNFGGQASKSKDQPNTTNITLDLGASQEFGPANLMLGMLSASRNLEKNAGKSESQLFQENTATFFSVFEEQRGTDKQSLWWQLHIPVISSITGSEHLKTYCHYIRQGSVESSARWIDDHGDELRDFGDWLQQ